MKYLIIFLLISNFAYSKDYALVFGGVSREQGTIGEVSSEPNEFVGKVELAAKALKAKGYEVTTLFDSVDTQFEESNNKKKKKSKFDEAGPMGLERAKILQEKNKQHFQYLRDNFQAKSMTEENIKKSLEDLLNKAQSGDRVQFFLNAHGTLMCNGVISDDDASKVSNSSKNCEHRIGVLDPKTGEYEYLPTKIITDYIKKFDAKGINLNFISNSCHSGSLQSELKDLKNTCSFLASSANNVGYSCFPFDADDDLSYTAVGDMFLFSIYNSVKSEVDKDPMFANDKCLGKNKKHWESSGFQMKDSMEELFWQFRSKDHMPEEPIISSSFDLESFQNGAWSSRLRMGHSLCYNDAVAFLLKDLEKLNELERPAVTLLINDLKNKIQNYNSVLSKQTEIIKKQNLDEIRNAQKETADAALVIIKAERKVTDLIKNKLNKTKTNENNPCQRKFL